MAECVSAEKKNNFEEIRLVCYNSMFFSWQFSNKGHILSHIYCQRLRLLDYCCCNTANFRELPLWTQSSSLLLGLFPLKLKGPWWEWAVLYISSFICFTWCCNWRLDLAASWCFSCNCCSQSFEQVCTCLNTFEQVWTHMNKLFAHLTTFEQVLNKFDYIWTDLNTFERVLNKFEHVWTCLNTFEQIWTHMNKFLTH